MTSMINLAFHDSDCKESDLSASGATEDPGLIPGSGRSPGEGHGNPLQDLAGRFQRREDPGGLQSTGRQRVAGD